MQYEYIGRPAYTVLRVRLEPGEDIWAEPGAMMALRGDIRVETKGYGGIFSSLKRALFGGESYFLNHYIAEGRGEVWLAPGTPGDIHEIRITPERGFVVQDTSYLAHHGDVKIDIAWRGFRGLLAEGELVWLKLEGEGIAWVSSYGSIERIEVPAGERIIVDNFHFVALDSQARWRIRKFGGLKSFLFGGEGIVIEIEGPAEVYVQTRILPVFAELLRKYLPSKSS